MTYNPNWPLAGNTPQNSVSQIQTNFSTFSSNFSQTSGSFSLNHMAFNNPLQGNHGVVIFDNQSQDPNVTGSWCSLYAKTAKSAVNPSGIPQLFIRLKQFVPNGFANSPMQLTYNTVNTSGPQYQSFLLGGLIVYWGQITDPGGNPTIFSPVPSSILFVEASPLNTTSGNMPSITVVATPTPRFTYFWPAGPGDIFGWWAVGRV